MDLPVRLVSFGANHVNLIRLHTSEQCRCARPPSYTYSD